MIRRPDDGGSIDGVVARALEQIAGCLPFEGAVVYWHVPELGVLWPLARTGSFMDSLPPVRPGWGVVGYAFATRRTAVAGNDEIARFGAPWHRSEGVQTLLALPLVAGGGAYGIVAAFSRAVKEVGEADRIRCGALAGDLLDVLRGAALWPIAQLQRFQINTLAEMVHECAATDDELRICATIARHAQLLTGCDTIGFSDGSRVDLFEGGYAAAPGHRRLQIESRAFTVNAISARTRTVLAQPLAPSGTRLVMAWNQSFTPTIEQQRLGEIIARYAATVIENGRARRDVADRERRARFLSHASNVLSSSLDLPTVIRAIERLAVPDIADIVIVHLAPSGDEAVVIPGSRTQTAFRMAMRANGALAAAAEGRTVRATYPLAIDGYIHAAATVPMIAAGRIIGAIAFGRTRLRGTLSDADVAVYEELALHGAAAVANAVSFGQQRDVADTLQRALLPSTLPADPRLIFDAAYAPAGAHSRIGGDWYDAFPLSPERIAFSIGDVAGHGLKAAVTMNVVRQAFRTAALIDAEPPVVLSRANDVLALDLAAPVVTAIFAVVNVRTRALRYACAGHPPPLLVHADGNAEMLPTDGLPMGVVRELRPMSFERVLAPGDTLYFYTDGVTEYGRDVLAGEARLGCVASSVTHAAPRARAARTLLDAIFADAERTDDAAILSVSVPLDQRDIAWVLPVRPETAADVRGRLRDLLHELPLAPARHFEFLTATGEAVVSALDHASRCGAAAITVQARYDEGRTWVDVSHEGDAGDAAAEDGSGVAIMTALADRMTVSTTPQGRTIRLEFDAG